MQDRRRLDFALVRCRGSRDLDFDKVIIVGIQILQAFDHTVQQPQSELRMGSLRRKVYQNELSSLEISRGVLFLPCFPAASSSFSFNRFRVYIGLHGD